ncbi:hypothetical protein K2173_006036 [Erythroxylum novogranatense]|uniref:HTH myb-type domain-containing protein n=1 Tax=Erythroxylum novogranatense TaxID=1862640 RepID=A0AAV8TD29_9ROSI|nr:hypothetical protein K2173_006036 [Erythroxylum novogranatense]
MELCLDLSLSYTPKTITDFLCDVSRIKDGSQKLSKLDNYLKRLEQELRKIDAFKRELPLSMLLLNDAIERLKSEAMRCKESNDRVVNEKPEGLEMNCDEDEKVKLEDDIKDKRMWMSSVQLWSSNDINFDCQKQDEKSESKKSDEDDDRSTCENPIQFCNYRSTGFLPFKAVPEFDGTGKKEEKEVISQVTGLSPMAPVSKLGSCNWISTGNSNKQMKIQATIHQHQGNKKQRRCWSPELHHRFIDALERLGGPQVATPKQIRELMKVDGLTNDEVKSHLQKYRLHIRKHPGPTAASNGLWKASDRSNPSTSESVSPQGPLLGTESAKYTSSEDDEEDEKSESDSWNSRLHKQTETHTSGQSDPGPH